MERIQMTLPGLEPEPNWGPSGKQVYERTYSRVKPDGTRETWADTVRRVVAGNLALAPESTQLSNEAEDLFDAIYNFRLLPAGRHLWMSGVEGRQFLFNCYVAGWEEDPATHFEFVFDQLMQGGGVGGNYSVSVMPDYRVHNLATVHFVLDPKHPDYKLVKDALSSLGMERVLCTSREKVPYYAKHKETIIVDDSREGWVSALGTLIRATTNWATDERDIDGETGVYSVPVVYDLNNIRAAGTPIKTFGGTSAGPTPLVTMLWKINRHLSQAWLDGLNGPIAMEMDHVIAECVVSGNVRRSARMSMMDWDDPWIHYFLACKQDGMHHWSTNISVIVDDEFFEAVNREDEAALAIYRATVEGMLKNGEPGLFNISLASKGERGTIIATNPCGEIPLEAWENCNLGHVNLDGLAGASLESILYHHTLMTRFLVRATFGDISNEATRRISNANRRIGVGHTGVAGYLAKRAIRLSEAMGSEEFTRTLQYAYQRVRNVADEFADQLNVPRPVKVTTVAPTGTVSKMPGVTEGIHPPYAKYFLRRIRYSSVDPNQLAAVNDYRERGYRVVDDIYAPNTYVVEIPTKELLVSQLEGTGNEEFIESIEDVSLEDALAFQAFYQTHWADNAISFTVNVQEDQYGVEEVMEVLLRYLPMVKGTTLMVDESRELAPYQRITKEVFDRYKDGHIDAGYDEACASGACPVK